MKTHFSNVGIFLAIACIILPMVIAEKYVETAKRVKRQGGGGGGGGGGRPGQPGLPGGYYDDDDVYDSDNNYYGGYGGSSGYTRRQWLEYLTSILSDDSTSYYSAGSRHRHRRPNSGFRNYYRAPGSGGNGGSAGMPGEPGYRR